MVERTAIIGDQGNDDTIFLMNAALTDATNGRTENSNFLSLTPAIYYYNESLTNQSIFDRYVGAFPSDIAAAAGVTGDGLFKAFIPSVVAFGTGALTIVPVDFSNVSYNTGSYFDGADTYTASYSGVYDFTVMLDIDILTFTGTNPIDSALLQCVFNQFDSGGTQLRTLTVFNNLIHSAGNYAITGTERVVMNAGDYLVVAFTKIDSFGNTTTGQLNVTSFWQCTSNTLGSGIFKDYDYLDYPINIFEFEYPIHRQDWLAVLSNPNYGIEFSMEGRTPKIGYIREVKRNHATGTGTFRLINTYRQNAD